MMTLIFLKNIKDVEVEVRILLTVTNSGKSFLLLQSGVTSMDVSY